jgi:hypothetical protein
MPRYYFDISDETKISPDQKGREFEDLGAAKAAATLIAFDHTTVERRADHSRFVWVKDDAGRTVSRLKLVLSVEDVNL